MICWRTQPILACVLQLVLEVVQQLQRMFQPDIKQIKKRIEDLIQREFLVRWPSYRRPVSLRHDPDHKADECMKSSLLLELLCPFWTPDVSLMPKVG